MWLMEAAQVDPVESQPERIAVRILVINIATIHTTAAVRHRIQSRRRRILMIVL